MDEAKMRKVYAPEFKATVGLEALSSVKTINMVGQEYGVHPAQVAQWKNEIQEQARTLFEGKRGTGLVVAQPEPEPLFDEFARMKLELERLKKAVRDQPIMTRRTWIDPQDEVSIVRQCALAGVSRTTFYAARKPRPVDADELVLKRLINEEYARNPLYGSRTMVVFLKAAGHIVNRKRVQRLMRESGLIRDVAGSRCNVAGMEGE